jgi:hypothetical protein
MVIKTSQRSHFLTLLTGIDDAGRQTIMAAAFNGPVTSTYDLPAQLTALTNPRDDADAVRISPVRRGRTAAGE